MELRATYLLIMYFFICIEACETCDEVVTAVLDKLDWPQKISSYSTLHDGIERWDGILVLLSCDSVLRKSEVAVMSRWCTLDVLTLASNLRHTIMEFVRSLPAFLKIFSEELADKSF